MLSVIQSGPSIERRYRSTTSYQASVHHNSALRVPLYQSLEAAEMLLAAFNWRPELLMFDRVAGG